MLAEEPVADLFGSLRVRIGVSALVGQQLLVEVERAFRIAVIGPLFLAQRIRTGRMPIRCSL